MHYALSLLGKVGIFSYSLLFSAIRNSFIYIYIDICPLLKFLFFEIFLFLNAAVKAFDGNRHSSLKTISGRNSTLR